MQTESLKMTGGTLEVRSDKSLTLLTNNIWHSTNGPMDQRTRYPQDIPKISWGYSEDIPNYGFLIQRIELTPLWLGKLILSSLIATSASDTHTFPADRKFCGILFDRRRVQRIFVPYHVSLSVLGPATSNAPLRYSTVFLNMQFSVKYVVFDRVGRVQMW